MKDGWKEGRTVVCEGRKEGRKDMMEDGRKDMMEDGRTEGRKVTLRRIKGIKGRKIMKEGREDGRKSGREGRTEGSKEGWMDNQEARAIWKKGKCREGRNTI